MKTNSVLLGAAIAGLMSAAATPAFAATAEVKGHCMGANSCKGKTACATATNGCAGENACKGKGYIETTKSDCEKLMKKDKKVKFEG